MKIISYIFFSIFLFFTMGLNAQDKIHLDTISFCYFDGITEQTQTIDEYQITNNSSEDYLTWISLVLIHHFNQTKIAFSFFKKIVY